MEGDGSGDHSYTPLLAVRIDGAAYPDQSYPYRDQGIYSLRIELASQLVISVACALLFPSTR